MEQLPEIYLYAKSGEKHYLFYEPQFRKKKKKNKQNKIQIS